MPRGPRLKVFSDRGCYHVMSRTARQAFLFHSDAIKEWMYKHVVWLSRIYYVDLYSATIMDNHYHLVLRMRKPEPDEEDVKKRFDAYQKGRRQPQRWGSWRFREWVEKLTDLSWFMKILNEDIARYVNGLDGKRGHVIGERFKSILIEDGIGLLQCMSYVELNCVRADICESPTEYRFCSVGRYHQGGPKQAGLTFPNLNSFAFLGSRMKQQKAFGLFVDHLAREFKGEIVEFPKEYGEIEKLVNDTSIKEFVDLVFRRTTWAANSLILGSEAFCQKMIDDFKLQPMMFGNPTPFRLSGALCNGHQRAGPHAA